MQLQPQHSPQYSHIRDAVRRCEDIGVDVAFNWDHFFPLYGDPDGAHYECWTMLGAWAEQTSRLEIGALVTCNSYRNPELLADMARTVDHISEGRLILGIGSGWKQKDYDEYGYEFGTAGSRLDDLAAAHAAHQVTADQAQPATHPGHPRPDRRSRRAEDAAPGRRVRRHLARVHHAGDVPREGGDPGAALRRRRPRPGHHRTLRGRRRATASTRCCSEADAFVELGVTMLTVGVNGPDYDLTQAEALCRWRDRRQANGN